MFRQTDDTRKKRRNIFVEQGIDTLKGLDLVRKDGLVLSFSVLGFRINLGPEVFKKK